MNLELTPFFRKRKGVASSTPTSSSTTASVLPSAPSQVEDDEVFPSITDLRTGKMTVVDGEAGVPEVVNLSEVSPKV